ETGLQNNSVTGQFHYVRLQTPRGSADSGHETTKRTRRAIIPGLAKSHASNDWEENRNGIVLVGVAAGNGLMLPLAGKAFPPRLSEGPPPKREAAVFPGNSAKTAGAIT